MSAVSAKTLRAYLSAIRSRHVDMTLPVYIFEHPAIARMLAGATSLNPTLSSRKTKVPITRNILQRLMPDDNSIAAVNATAAFALAFAGFLRMGEITYTKQQRDCPLYQHTRPTRSDITFGPNFLTFRLKRSKTDSEKQGVSITIAATGDAACPVQAMRRLWTRDPQPHSTPLFATEAGAAFTRHHLLGLLHHRMGARGIDWDGVTGHSFRYGAAQYARTTGVSDFEIQRLGRWTSEAFRLYCSTSPTDTFLLSYRFQTGTSQPLGTGISFRGPSASSYLRSQHE
jgi:hypothetical protein